MELNIIEKNNVVIGEQKEIVKYLIKQIELTDKNSTMDKEEKTEKKLDIHNLISKIVENYENKDLLYLKRKNNGDLIVYYLDTELL